MTSPHEPRTVEPDPLPLQLPAGGWVGPVVRDAITTTTSDRDLAPRATAGPTRAELVPVRIVPIGTKTGAAADPAELQGEPPMAAVDLRRCHRAMHLALLMAGARLIDPG